MVMIRNKNFRKVRILFSSVLIFAACNLFAQQEKVSNLPKYYHEKLHFGFTIGVNKADFILRPVKFTNLSDSLKIVNSKKQYGFNLGIIAELRLTEYLAVRLLPDLSFASRTLDFHFSGSKEYYVITKDVESTYIDFPIDLKLRSKRLNNMSAYIVGGGKYVIDLASQKSAKNKSTNIEDIVIKLRKNDIAYQMGAGFEFYLEYFKFGIEGKLSIGTKNLIIKDGTELSNAIERMNAKMFLISFTFEG
jgi:hypothetical protein